MRIETEVLVIGAGAAGLCAALAAAPRRTVVLSAGVPSTSASTALAQGGVAAPIGAGDSVAAHVMDTLTAASHSGVESVAMHLVSRAAETIEYLQRMGVAFDRDTHGYSLHLEAGHSTPRVLHVDGDRSGSAILHALLAQAQAAAHIELLANMRVVTLLQSPSGAVVGALALDEHSQWVSIVAGATVLATGGVGQLFSHTTNEAHATGDGLAMAMEVGAQTAGLEFVQFHPTALLCRDDPLPLLTEALRGAGAVLIDSNGQPLMLGKHPRADLAPRDVVGRAVWEQEQHGESVLLDARDLFCSSRAAEFPGAALLCRIHGVDPARQPIPVTAAAHYHMGGVVVDVQGRTTVPGLWACGEVAFTGLHGANRLASNSLLEAVVCGRIVGTTLAHSSVAPLRSVPTVALPVPLFDRVAWQCVREQMWRHLGPVRERYGLEQALRVLHTVQRMLPVDAMVLDRRIGLALAMLSAALARKESRGAHWRSDFPCRDVHRDGALALRDSSAEMVTRKHAGHHP